MLASQQNALKTSSPDTALFAQDNGNSQPPQNQHFSYAKPQTKATPITKVYYRKRFKGHAGNFEEMVTVEQMPKIAGGLCHNQPTNQPMQGQREGYLVKKESVSHPHQL